MATFRITPSNSVTTNTNGDHAFDSDTPGADTLIVDAGAYLHAMGPASQGALLAATGGWKVTVNGSISAANYSALSFTSTFSRSTITIGEDGELIGGSGIGSRAPITVNNAGTIVGVERAIILADSGALTLNNTGTIRGQYAIFDSDGLSKDNVTNSGTLDGIVNLRGQNDVLRNSGLITGAVEAGTGNDVVTNSGELRGSVYLDEGNDRFTNSGLVKGAVDLGSGTGTMANSGTIEGSVSGGIGKDKISNSGTIKGSLNLDNGRDSVVNKGIIEGNINADGDNDTITNAGTIGGNVNLGEGADTLTNSRIINGNVNGNEGNDSVTNSGAIDGRVSLGDGDDRLTNKGSIAGNVLGEAGADKVTNSGLVSGYVSLGDGLNTLTNTGTIAGPVFGGDDKDIVKNSGVIESYVDLGGGNDSFTGGKYGDYVADSAGSDSIRLGGGNDIYYGHGDVNPVDDGIDTVDGSAGYDVYNASTATDSVYINLDKVAHDISPLNPGAMPVAAGTAFGAQLGTDKIMNFEEAIGGSGHDVIYGSALANVLEGGEGSDVLFGFGGHDVLIGGEGDDTLAGGTSTDLLYSGSGYDSFVFTSLADSGTSPATRDAIMDFESGFDLIVLSPIDAIKTNGPGDDTFNFIGDVAFSGVAGQLRAYAIEGGQLIEGDVNGDGKADFSIEVSASPLTGVLTAGDFLL